MKIRESLSWFIGMVVIFLSTTAFAATASLQVTILDENGSLLKQAHLYMFSQNKKEFFGTLEAHGVTRYDLPAGDYVVYAGRTEKNNGAMDHYASPETTIHVTVNEPTSVILCLQKAVDSDNVVTDDARRKMGIDDELAKYLN
jgi:hypothetical protein